MSVSASDDFEATSRCGSLDVNSEGRSSEQVENGNPSTSPPYYDSDVDEEGPKPSELYGRHTWTIEKFQTISKRELRGEVFDVGGYKWYILIYPKGCDVCNHLSLFLCVANHDKLLPGWSHLAQFSIAVVNKDPKKSKYSDTLHRFWKKEHDWGWKKFMELSKVEDGFIDDDENLVIKAQVQVIRERTNGPFRCLDLQYRRELVRVYLSNVEQVCRHFVEERKNKLSSLFLDKNKWASFRAFWSGIDRISRRRITRDQTESILKLLVKHFFIEKEVTSTLVMDALYTGLKVLEWQSRGDARLALRLPGLDDMPEPLVRIDEDVFVLADDIVNLVERVASEPALRRKEEKNAQTAKKDGVCAEDAHKESIESDERRLTEMGRRMMEMFVLGHLFSQIEIAYQESVALKRQEELIREEELFGSSSDLRSKHGGTNKEKRASKKKQTKQKRNSRKENKGKTKDFTLDGRLVDNSNESDTITNKPDDTSDLSDNQDFKPEPLQPDLNETNKREEAILSSVDIKIQEFTPGGRNSRRRLSKGGSRKNKEEINQFSGTNVGASTGASSPPPDAPTHSGRYYSGNYRGPRSESENLVVSLKDRIKLLQQRLVEVEDSLLKKFNAKELGEVFSKTETGNESASAQASASASASSSSSPVKINKSSGNHSSNLLAQENSKRILENTSPSVKQSEPIKSISEGTTTDSVVTNRAQSNGAVNSSPSSKTENQKQKQKQKQIIKEKNSNAVTSASSTRDATNPVTAKANPLQKPAGQPAFSITPSASTHPPQSYRNAITGSNPPVAPSQPPVVVPPEHGLRFGTVTIEPLDGEVQQESSNESCVSSSVEKLELHEEPQNSHTEEAFPEMEPSSLSSCEQSGLVPDEFPHLDIINDLLEEDQSNGYNHSFFSRQYSLPDRASMAVDVSPSWPQQPEAYYESFPRVYGSFGTPCVNVSAYSDSQIEMLPSQYAYLRANSFSVMPGANVGDVSSYTMYGSRVGEYSANLASGAVGDGYSTLLPKGKPQW